MNKNLKRIIGLIVFLRSSIALGYNERYEIFDEARHGYLNATDIMYHGEISIVRSVQAGEYTAARDETRSGLTKVVSSRIEGSDRIWQLHLSGFEELNFVRNDSYRYELKVGQTATIGKDICEQLSNFPYRMANERGVKMYLNDSGGWQCGYVELSCGALAARRLLNGDYNLRTFTWQNFLDMRAMSCP
ncbi:MAG: hypothetical protein H7318_14255 [Oligoflexus sp.]|nr:hypothetical protein [Oligoflexus sp.]